MRIVLLGDMHLYTLSIAPWRLLSKRILGQTNLWLRRHRAFDRRQWSGLANHARALGPDVVLGSGDVSTTALPHEFELAKDVIRPIAQVAETTFFVPGNHDRYTFASMRRRDFETYFGEWTTTDWPHHRVLADGLHLVGVDPTRPTLLTASGRCGARQLDKLRAMLAGIDKTHKVIVVCHYPPGTPPGQKAEHKQHRLIDQTALVGVLGDAGHDVLFLHGHVHEVWCWRMGADVAPNVVAVNAGAPVMHNRRWPHGEGFWQIDVDVDAKVDTGGGDADNDSTGWLRLVHHAADADGEWRGTEVAAPNKPGEVARVAR